VRCHHASTEAKSNGDPRGRALEVNRPQGQALLTVDGLYGGYGRGRHFRNVLADVSLSIRSGECLAIVGESGSGKTTLGRCIAGLHRPAGGSIKLGGFQLPGSAAERSREQLRAIQIIFQNPERSLNPTRTVAQALSRPLRLFGFTEHRRERSMIADLLERVRLPRTMLDRYPRELSGGEKQRVAIARALAARPSLLVCDEITSALDVSIQAAIVSLLEGLRADGLTMLFITHNLALVHSIADDVVVLQAGVVREVGPAARVISQPSDPYTQSLLHAALDLTRAAPVVGHEQD
jgi:peptide/nickel transport system ATP-binding protein